MRDRFYRNILDRSTALSVGIIILVVVILTTLLNLAYSAVFMDFGLSV